MFTPDDFDADEMDAREVAELCALAARQRDQTRDADMDAYFADPAVIAELERRAAYANGEAA